MSTRTVNGKLEFQWPSTSLKFLSQLLKRPTVSVTLMTLLPAGLGAEGEDCLQKRLCLKVEKVMALF